MPHIFAHKSVYSTFTDFQMDCQKFGFILEFPFFTKNLVKINVNNNENLKRE